MALIKVGKVEKRKATPEMKVGPNCMWDDECPTIPEILQYFKYKETNDLLNWK